MRPRHEYEEVQRWLAWGMNDCAISRLTGIPRKTVQGWRVQPRLQLGTNCPQCEGARLDEAAYAYLLGLYLGDGHIARQRRFYSLRITLDERYPSIIQECRDAVETIRGGAAQAYVLQREGCVSVVLGWKHWPCVFPQHGAGAKHSRSIALRTWQQQIADRHPERLLRGLITPTGGADSTVWSSGARRMCIRGTSSSTIPVTSKRSSAAHVTSTASCGDR